MGALGGCLRMGGPGGHDLFHDSSRRGGSPTRLSAGYPDGFGDKAGVVAAILDYIPDYTRGDKGPPCTGEQEHRFEARLHFSVGLGDGFFEFKIGGVSKATEQEMGALTPGKIHG